MRKLLVILVCLAALTGGVWAQDAIDVRALAAHFPEDTLIYASIRSDKAYFDTLDGLLAQISGALTEAGLAVPPLSIGETLAEITNAGGSFDETLRPWLGDTMALGVLSVEGIVTRGDTRLIVAFELDDREKAVAFLESAVSPGRDIVQMAVGDRLIITTDSTDQGFVVTDDVMLVYLNAPFDDQPAERSLLDKVTFTEVTDLLPASSYNALIYADLPALLDAGLASADAQPNPQDRQTINLLFDLVGAHALGLTVLEGGSYAADLAALPGSMPLPGSSTPIDPAFAAHIPANASLVIQGADLRAVYDSTVESLRQFASANDQPTEEFDRLLGQIAFAVRGLTGLEFDEFRDALAGSYAVFATYAPTDPGTASLFGSIFYPNDTVPINVGAGLVLDAGQTAQALAEAVIGLFEMQPPAGATLSDETVAGVDVAVLSFAPPPTISNSLDLVIGANEGLLVIATRPEAEAILSGEAGLDTSAAFASALEVALPNTGFFAYTDSSGIRLFSDAYVGLVASQPLIALVFDNIVASLNDPQATPDPNAMDRLIEELRPQFTAMQTASQAFSDLFQHGIISGAAAENGGYLLRLALTLD